MGVIFPEPKPSKRQPSLDNGKSVGQSNSMRDETFNTLQQIANWVAANSCANENKYIKCEYCNSELEDKYVNCPNCGAPLKRGLHV